MPEPELRSARPKELGAITGLLSAAGLPVVDLDGAMLDAFVVAIEGKVCIGVVGLEICGSDALLRSLAVEPCHRSRGLGARLVDAIETEARVRGVTALYLLTTTATTFFERLGYTAQDRAAVPPSIAVTTEFSSLCPDTADCLWRDLSTRPPECRGRKRTPQLLFAGRVVPDGAADSGEQLADERKTRGNLGTGLDLERKILPK